MGVAIETMIHCDRVQEPSPICDMVALTAPMFPSRYSFPVHIAWERLIQCFRAKDVINQIQAQGSFSLQPFLHVCDAMLFTLALSHSIHSNVHVLILHAL